MGISGLGGAAAAETTEVTKMEDEGGWMEAALFCSAISFSKYWLAVMPGGMTMVVP